jgi:hypothetical protein
MLDQLRERVRHLHYSLQTEKIFPRTGCALLSADMAKAAQGKAGALAGLVYCTTTRATSH